MNNTEFGYMDEDCTIKRQTTIENLILANTAREWLYDNLERIVGLCTKLKHKDLKSANSWSIIEINEINHDHINLSLKHSAYDSCNDDYTSLVFPTSWILEDGEKQCINYCKGITDKEAEIKRNAEIIKQQQIKEEELKLFKTLQLKYKDVV